MNPETISAITALAALVRQMGTWPIASMLLVVLFGPWVVMFLLNRQQEKKFDTLNQAQSARFDSVKHMYESNVTLVKAYEKVADIQCEVITLNTAKWSESIQKIDSNQFCPFSRIRKQIMEDIPGERNRETPRGDSGP